MEIAAFIGAVILCGILYHLGGIGNPYPPKLRDWGCSLVSLGVFYLLSAQFSLLPYFLTFLLSWGALSTYWKGDAPDVLWYHWFLHGLGVGLSSIPLTWIGITWWLILIRAFILGALMMWVSEKNSDVFKEEFGRGSLIILTLPILFM